LRPARPFQDLVEWFSDLLRSGEIRRARSPSVSVSFAMIMKENPQAAVYTSPLLRAIP
jgi:hypothetical protein